ncbi:hypothetical protein K2173_026098 [Erythroxylum novogranatense]|uniref:CCDC93 coiled-coil domain-containing protein n=1 Tax=Erythroxylum novogranatense TaxID=1862640 RepID=A0AAV8SI74_9ROSI|nr:hypothetical protein K2173_026098 [Erythroxylum novogranatense]
MEIATVKPDYEVSACTEHPFEEDELRQLRDDLRNARASMEMERLKSNLDNQNGRKIRLLNDLRKLRERIDMDEGANANVQKLVLVLKSDKALEAQESVLRSKCQVRRAELEEETRELEDKLRAGWESDRLSEDLDCLLARSLEKLNLARKELAGKLRAVVSITRQLGDIPIQAELIQYECGFSELNTHIQEKHRQTRKYYGTYNALLEIKELMLKETSLLNSISTQFQDAIMSADGRLKLIDSMEAIVKGSQQKLQKVEVRLEEEQKACDALKKRYAAAMVEQRRCYSLLKTVQEACAKNEKLQSQKSV